MYSTNKSGVSGDGWLDETGHGRVVGKIYGVIDHLLDQVANGHLSNFRMFNKEHFSGRNDYLSNSNILRYLKKNDVISPRAMINLSFTENDKPKFPQSTISDTLEISVNGRSKIFSIFGQGIGFTGDQSISVAMGEFVERFFLAKSIEKSRIVLSTERDFSRSGEKYVPLARIPSFNAEQVLAMPELRRGDNPKIFWVKTKNITRGEEWFVPAQRILWTSELLDKEPILVDQTTNGGGGGFSREESVLSGLYEIIERDSFFMFWLNNKTPPKVNPNSFGDSRLNLILSILKRYLYDPIFLDITTDTGIPSVLCILIDRGSGEIKISLGGGSGFSVEKLFVHSALEALSVNRTHYINNRFSMSENYKPFLTRGVGRKERLSIWRGDDMLGKIYDFINNQEKPASTITDKLKTFESKADEIDFVIKNLKKLGEGYDIFVHEVSDILLENLGYSVSRVFVPSLFPLYLNEHLATLKSARLESMSGKLNTSIKERLISSFPPIPHPFP